MRLRKGILRELGNMQFAIAVWDRREEKGCFNNEPVGNEKFKSYDELRHAWLK